MLKSEKLAAGPAMSLNGSYYRLFKTNSPFWFKAFIAPWLLFCWWFFIAMFYMCGGFLLFAGSRRRKQLVEIERQKELVAAIKQNANRG